MLHWQHRSVRNRLNLWVKLGLISFGAHMLALSFLLFVYKDSVIDLAFTVRSPLNNIDVVWVRELPAAKPAVNSQKGNGNQKRNTAPAKKQIQKPKTSLKQEAPQPKKDPKKNQKKQPVQKKEEKKKQEPKKVEASKKQEEKKKPEPKKPDPKKEVPVTPKPEESINASIDAHLPNQSTQDQEPLNVQVCSSYREFEAMRQFSELQQEIARCWRPPVGIGADVSCQIAVTFDWDGKLVHVETVKQSGILMFDVSSRDAVSHMEAPKFVRGKTFTITFKP